MSAPYICGTCGATELLPVSRDWIMLSWANGDRYYACGTECLATHVAQLITELSGGSETATTPSTPPRKKSRL